jgi:hypothetical protein
MKKWARLNVKNINSIKQGDKITKHDRDNVKGIASFPIDSIFVVKHISHPQFGEVTLLNHSSDASPVMTMRTKIELVSQCWWWLPESD